MGYLVGIFRSFYVTLLIASLIIFQDPYWISVLLRGTTPPLRRDSDRKYLQYLFLKLFFLFRVGSSSRSCIDQPSEYQRDYPPCVTVRVDFSY